MGCLKPIQTYKISKGQQVKFKKYSEVDVLKWDMNLNWKKNDSVPCRKCIGCRLDNAREWAIRCTFESQMYKDNWFVTLTYSPDNLPINEIGIPTCKRKELNKFINSVRKHFERQGHFGIKYLAASEYGTKSKRPHYHILFFNLPLNDCEMTGAYNNLGQPYFVSKLLDKIWNKGMIMIGQVSYESAGYVARYNLKKQSKIDYEKYKLEPEKVVMSKGIGKEYFYRNYEKIYKYDCVYVMTDKGMKRLKPPRYFDRLYDELKPDKLQEIIARRNELAKKRLGDEIMYGSCDYVSNLGLKQSLLDKKIKSLKKVLTNKK